MKECNLAFDWIAAKEGQIIGKPLNKRDDEAIVNLLELIMANPDDAFKTILEIIKLNPSKRVLAQLGAGPIEGLLFDHPEYLEKFIESETDTDAIRHCLQFVNYNEGDGLGVKLLEDFLRRSASSE